MIEGIAPHLTVEILTFGQDLDRFVKEIFVFKQVKHVCARKLFVASDEVFVFKEIQDICLGTRKKEVNKALDLSYAARLFNN